MRFSITIAAFGFVALVSAQTSVNGTSTSEAAPSPTNGGDSPTSRCLNACADADLCCQASCVGVPCPSDLQANQTTECAAQCEQGNGTEEETAAYAACQSSCISSLFFPLSSTAGGAAATGTGAGASDATATATNSDSDSGIGASSSDGGSPSETGAAASASSTGDSDNGAVRKNIAGAGLLGLVIAGLAL